MSKNDARDDTDTPQDDWSAVQDAPGSYALTVVFSWLLPGAGYWILGQRVRGVLFFAALMSLFWGGQLAAGFKGVDRSIHPYFFYGQMGNGLSALVSEYSLRAPSSAGGRAPSRDLPAHLSTGLNFTTISGLLNLLLVLHIMDPKTWTAAAKSREEDAGGWGREESR